jgi:hypothetical protein
MTISFALRPEELSKLVGARLRLRQVGEAPLLDLCCKAGDLPDI